MLQEATYCEINNLNGGNRMVWHIGTFKLADPEKAQEAVDLLYKLKDIVPGTIDYKVGINLMQSPTAATVCLIGVFDSKETLEAYMNHPVHIEEVGPAIIEMCNYEILERMTSCDMEF